MDRRHRGRGQLALAPARGGVPADGGRTQAACPRLYGPHTTTAVVLHAVRRSVTGETARGRERGMDAPRTLPDPPKTEDLQVFLALALPIFAVTALIIVIVLQLSPK